MSYIIAIDVGIKNLGLCIFDFRTAKVVEWENASLVSSGRYVPSNNVKYVRDFIRRYLNTTQKESISGGASGAVAGGTERL